jgi:hypothetical protein
LPNTKARFEVLDRTGGLPVTPIVVRNTRSRTVGPRETIPSQGKGSSKVFEAMQAILEHRKKQTS